jgi:peptidoglycan/LPS O-acetylase OafA/YrhL
MPNETAKLAGFFKSPAMTQQKPNERLKELDGWRAVSVLLVILHHLGAYQLANLVSPHVRLTAILEDCGPLGVKVFFVISGFVICRLLILEESRYGAVSLKTFYVRRVFRILPPFFLYVGVISLLLSVRLLNDSWSGICNGALFLYDFVPAERGSWFIGHTWSLAVEEQFYLVFPALWVLTKRIGRNRVFPVVFCLIVLWNLSTTVSGWDQLTILSARSGFSCICCGVLIAIFERRARSIAKSFPTFAITAILLGLLWHPVDHTGWKSALYDCMLIPPAIALLLLFSLERSGGLRTFLCWKPIQTVGLMSYGVYLWQQLFTAPAKFYTVSGRPLEHLAPLLFVIVPLSYVFVEKPAVRLGSELAARIRQRAVGREVAA